MPRPTPQLRLIALPGGERAPYDLDTEAERIRSLPEFVTFLAELRSDFHASDEEWPNDVLERYLAGLNNAAEDLAAFRCSEPPSWSAFARLLLAATVNE